MFEFAGGEPAFLALATAHHQRCLDDPVLNHPFSHPGHPEHVQRLASYWAEVFGGPPRYSQSCGGQSAMLGLHAGTGAEGDIGDRFVECFVRAADDVGLPDDPDFRRELRSYMQWAVDQVMSISPVGATVEADLSVPRWSWDGLQSAPVSGSK
jgi:hemoglobin